MQMLKVKHVDEGGLDGGPQREGPWLIAFLTHLCCLQRSLEHLSTQVRPGFCMVLSDSKGTKHAGSIDVGDLGRPPPAAASGADPALVSFSEQVPESQRITLRQSHLLSEELSESGMQAHPA